MLRRLGLAGVVLVAACGGAGDVSPPSAAVVAPAVLDELAGIAFGPFDRAARSSGHFLLVPDAGELALPGAGVAVVPFGAEVCPAGACRRSTGLELHGLRPGTEVLVGGAGTVEAVEPAAVVIRSSAEPATTVRYDHVEGIALAPGATVATGDRLGTASSYADGRFARMTLSVQRGGMPVCPITVLPEAQQTRVTGELLQFFVEWNALVGREVHDRRVMSPIGCVAEG